MLSPLVASILMLLFFTPASRNARARAGFHVFCNGHKECVELNAKDGVFGDTRVRGLATGRAGGNAHVGVTFVLRSTRVVVARLVECFGSTSSRFGHLLVGGGAEQKGPLWDITRIHTSSFPTEGIIYLLLLSGGEAFVTPLVVENFRVCTP